jgi:nucleotide-binding universal stress UspA family protein
MTAACCRHVARITLDRGIGRRRRTLIRHRGPQIRETPVGLEADRMYKNILAAVDGTAHGAAVLDAASSLAKLTGATVHVIHIRPLQVIGGVFAPSAVVSAEEDADGRRVLDEALARLHRDGVTADGEVDDGLREDLADILVERARTLGSDLIAVGPGHYSGIEALLHPSVSKGVARIAPVSVLLVHSEA